MLRWALLFLSFLVPDKSSDNQKTQQEDFPRESPGYKDSGRTVSTADNSNAARFRHISPLRWDPS